MFGALVSLIVGAQQSEDMVAFMLREVTASGEIADLVYAEFLEPRHRDLCGLWAMATGRGPEDEELKLAIFAMIGQVVYFRIARPLVARRMGWQANGQPETHKIAGVVLANLRDTIERLRI